MDNEWINNPAAQAAIFMEIGADHARELAAKDAEIEGLKEKLESAWECAESAGWKPMAFPDGDRICVGLHPQHGDSVIVSKAEVDANYAEISRLTASFQASNKAMLKQYDLVKAKDAEIARLKAALTQHDVEFGLTMAAFRDTNWLVLTPERETEVRSLVNGGGDPRFTGALDHVLKSVVGMRNCIRRQNDTNGRLTREAKESGVTDKDREIANLRSNLGLAEFKLTLSQEEAAKPSETQRERESAKDTEIAALRSDIEAKDAQISRISRLSRLLGDKNVEITALRLRLGDKDTEISQLKDKLDAANWRGKVVDDERKRIVKGIRDLNDLRFPSGYIADLIDGGAL